MRVIGYLLALSLLFSPFEASALLRGVAAGSGGSPGGSQYNVQLNNGSGGLTGSASLTGDALNDLFIAGGVGIGTSALTAGVSLDLGSETNSVLLPIGTTGQRPTGIAGMLRYNNAFATTTSNPSLEAFYNGNWNSFGPLLQQNMIVDQQIPNWRGQLGKVQTQTANLVWLCMGDSLTEGYNSSVGNTNNPPTSYCGQVETMLKNAGVPAISQNFMSAGSGGATPNYSYDTRVSIGSWATATVANDALTIGGYFMTATGAGTFSFTATEPVDTCKIYYPQFSGGGSFTYNVDGGSNGSTLTNNNASETFISATIAMGNPGLHTLNIPWVSGSAYWAWINCTNSTVKQVNVVIAGKIGGKVGDQNVNVPHPWNPGNATAIALLAPNFVTDMVAGNDWNTGTSLSSYLSSYTSVASNYAQSGAADFVILIPNTSNPATGGNASYATQLTYITKMYSLAASGNYAILDEWNRFYPYPTYQTAGMENTDGLHWTGSGQHDVAKSLYQFLMPGGGENAATSIYNLSYQPGLLTAVNANIGVYAKVSKSGVVDNLTGSAVTFSCVGNPTVTMYECGTSTTCAAPTAIGTVTLTTAATAFNGTVSNPNITAGDYIGWAMTAGTCASIDLSAVAQVHSN